MGLVLLVLLLLLILGGIPVAPWGGWHPYGYYPSGIGTVLLILLLVAVLSGRW